MLLKTTIRKREENRKNFNPKKVKEKQKINKLLSEAFRRKLKKRDRERETQRQREREIH